jgi:hypothetical protein
MEVGLVGVVDLFVIYVIDYCFWIGLFATLGSGLTSGFDSTLGTYFATVY